METSTKRLYRSRTNRIIAGVCGGLGDYFDIDPVLVRVIFVAFLLAFGSTALLYVILWLIVPNEPGARSTVKKTTKASKK